MPWAVCHTHVPRHCRHRHARMAIIRTMAKIALSREEKKFQLWSLYKNETADRSLFPYGLWLLIPALLGTYLCVYTGADRPGLR